ncbi:hypothetical protein PHAVU_007G110700 [Phaseolus vulgaris]|uniref:Uncharacterized protein n=1 Tax=Phaseolus vulgaris TaxID=3885 RepID=V7BDH6_PHAVU|nr:hypothetical protein PHAVU_007G110700g [Phaseolus vulgaris]ESW15884.1 hypothetical protein PHAVU_007G110700g [Phaseolus vulgaris]
MLGSWQLRTCMVQGDKGVSRLEMPQVGLQLTRELRSIPFNNVKALLDFTFISIAQCFCFLKQKFQFLCEAICKTASTNRAYHN